MSDYAAFISYSSRYKHWVAALRDNLELCLPRHGEKRRVFLDQSDLGVARSWVTGLQNGVDQAEKLVLVVTPEAMASPRVKNEWEAFVARERDWEGRLQVVLLVDTPLPPFLEPVQRIDFREHTKKKYEKALAELVVGILGKPDRRRLPKLDDAVKITGPPDVPVPPKLRQELVKLLALRLEQKALRPAVADALGLQHWRDFDGYPSIDCAAAASIVLATGEDDPVAGALRIVESLLEFFEDDEPLTRLREQLTKLQERRGESGLLGGWLKKVVQDHERLVPYFQQSAELTLLDRVYVQLQLSAEHLRDKPDEGFHRARGPSSLRDLLALDPADEPWVTRRWMVLGDPGSGKTTLLRHLAASVARQEPWPWVPVFESLPRMMRDREFLLKRIERQMKKAGEPGEGLVAVLEREGQEGRLLLLLDGLDEVPREDREEALGLLRQLSSRWPASPLVVTSRPIGYERFDGVFQEVRLLPFDGERRREFLARWFGREAGKPDRKRAEREARALEENAGLRDLASNPLYLTLMALLIEQGTSPNRQRTGLYDQVFKLLLDGGHKYPKAEPMEAQAAVRGVLRHLALDMTCENRDSEPVTALEARLYKPEADALREPLERLPRWRRSMRPFLDDLAERTGILGAHDGPDADWRYWHRTFREALASEALQDQIQAKDGEAALLAEVRQIAKDDFSRWAEPYALLTGRVKDPDALVKALVHQNRELGLRSLATAQGLRDETLFEVLKLTEEWMERAEVYKRLPELVDDSARALALIDQLRQRTRNGNDLFVLERTVMTAIEKWPDARGVAERMLGRFYDHIPAPPEELFQWIDTLHDGQVELWRSIPAGKFLMGSHPDEEDRYDDEGPQHEVVVKSPFRMAAVPVTVEQYKAFDPEHHSHFDESGHPANSVTWCQAYAFCRWLSAQPGTQGARLPTEEEWEYACRAGTQTRYWSGNKEADLERVGWYHKNSYGRTHRVGEKEANNWGLYDVHGNVWEWTLSDWSANYLGREDGVEVVPSIVDEESFALRAVELAGTPSVRRVIRGGSFGLRVRDVRAACRDRDDPGIVDRLQGFRVCLPAPPE